MAIKAVEIQLCGHLHRTGFRFFTMQKASEVKVRGFVKYNSDHSIMIHAEGEEPNLNTFLEWCRKGLPSCKVTSMSISEASTGNYQKFDILEN